MLFKPTSRETERGTCIFHEKELTKETLEGCNGEVEEETHTEKELGEGPEEASWNTEELIEAVFSAITTSDMVT